MKQTIDLEKQQLITEVERLKKENIELLSKLASSGIARKLDHKTIDRLLAENKNEWNSALQKAQDEINNKDYRNWLTIFKMVEGLKKK